MTQRLIAVIGESVFSHPDHATLAEEVGGRIAAAGCGLICGGLGGVIIIVLAAQAAIAIGGGAGTLSEIGHALRLGRRVVGLRTWDAAFAGRPADVQHAATAEEAVRLALEPDPVVRKPEP